MMLWFAEIPDCFGEGIQAVAETHSKARQALRKEWLKRRQTARQSARGCGEFADMSLDDAIEYFGGSVTQFEVGRAYFGGLRQPFG